MKNIAIIPNSVILPENFSNSISHIIRVKCQDTDTVQEVIARCGIALEEHLLDGSRPKFWQSQPDWDLATIVWQNPINILDIDVHRFGILRGDEIIFPTIDSDYEIDWTVGNPRAVVKWAQSVVHTMTSDLTPMHIPGLNRSMKLIWTAYRIGLKVYGVKS